MKKRSGAERSLSPQDPEAGLLIKGEHRREFAYGLQLDWNEHGWILAYDVCAGNELIQEDDMQAIFPYTAPKEKKGIGKEIFSMLERRNSILVPGEKP